MENLDNYVDRELAQKFHRNQERRSEAEYRLYWSTFRKAMAGKEPLPHNISQVWKRLPRFLDILRRRWTERIPSERRISEQEAQKQSLISEQREV